MGWGREKVVVVRFTFPAAAAKSMTKMSLAPSPSMLRWPTPLVLGVRSRGTFGDEKGGVGGEAYFSCSSSKVDAKMLR